MNKKILVGISMLF
ncbi:MAG: DUF4767 domain-containing protein [Lactobacillus helveticus]|uniref:Uncharacterized protein n=5 Tax=Lactobacillus helveticus TaxID=1587 RepID=U4QK14_LACHE|nr:Protein of unknown function [Lactobacillus helveticus CIRM-BIA 953]CDI58973.1 Protein of unknown function [Lactobacillus helveticus CIRM-BIA 951]